MRIVYLKAPQPTLEERYRERGSHQSEQFLKGRATKYRNLLSNVDLAPHIVEFENTNVEEQARVLAFLSNVLAPNP